ncbi:MAG: hypothetical protein HYU64_06380 [Armatimonadetes bacterium]|nr:hypothetical protein [Armatimonadota bacterium]
MNGDLGKVARTGASGRWEGNDKATFYVDVTDKDSNPNLAVTFSKDGDGKGKVSILNKGEDGNAAEIQFPLGDVSKAEDRYFQADLFGGQQIREAEVASDGKMYGVRVNKEIGYYAVDGAILSD